MRKLRSKIYEYLLNRYKRSIEKSRLEGKGKIIFLARELRDELHRQGYRLHTCNLPVSIDIHQYESMPDQIHISNIINGWAIREDEKDGIKEV